MPTPRGYDGATKSRSRCLTISSVGCHLRGSKETNVLHRLRDHISNCYTRAADARRRADQTSDPERRADLLVLAKSWTQLAQNYELSEQLGCVLLQHTRDVNDRMEWRRAAVAPFDRDLEIAVIGADGIQPVEFPCQRILHGWVAAESRKLLDVQPTHWRAWTSDSATGAVRTPVRLREAASAPARKAYLLPLQSNE